MNTPELVKKYKEKHNELGSYADNSLIDGTPMEARTKGIKILRAELGEIAIELISSLDDSESLKKLLDFFEWASVNVAITEKYNCLLIPQEKWDDVSDSLLKAVGPENWKDEWDY